jgi:CNT family concentrative nucleoside transporter
VLVLQSLFGLMAMLGIAILLSEDRRRIAWRTVLAGLALQLVLALVLVKLPLAQSLFAGLNQVVLVLDKATGAGTSFVFGYLGGDAFPSEVSDPSRTFVLAFQALPLVIVVSALSALLFYWRVLPWVVRQLARLLTRFMGIGAAVHSPLPCKAQSL